MTAPAACIALCDYIRATADPFLDRLMPSHFDHIDLRTYLACRTRAVEALLCSDHPRIHPTARISSHAIIGDSVFIGPHCVIHEFATVRDLCVLASHVHVGFGCEVARATVGSGSTITHRTTLADALVGADVHFGAGVLTANTYLFNADMRRPDRLVSIRMPSEDRYDLGVTKFSAVVGDYARIGMGSMIGPGAAVGIRAVLYPGSMVAGTTISTATVVKSPEVRELRRPDTPPEQSDGIRGGADQAAGSDRRLPAMVSSRLRRRGAQCSRSRWQHSHDDYRLGVQALACGTRRLHRSQPRRRDPRADRRSRRFRHSYPFGALCRVSSVSRGATRPRAVRDNVCLIGYVCAEPYESARYVGRRAVLDCG
ncbi:MAG: hypothetical protein QOH83_2519 [Solirubrobacteraceae bacterium]|nr:hypothetical protein [Solirubrobacteraceae bacterium]